MELLKKLRIPSYKTLLRYARALGFGDIDTRMDNASGLHAIIAIHNTKLGPALGGCRFYEYDRPELALEDALRLAYGMTLKAAACGVAHGGAKAVIIKPRHLTDRKAIFRAFGDFIQSLNGRYITAVDVGTTLDDMTTIFERTAFVVGAKGPGRIDDDPSPFTAKGVFFAIRAAVKFHYQRDNCEGMRAAIQGVGRVGFNLAKYLVEDGAHVTVFDTNAESLKHAVKMLDVKTVNPDQIESLPCDIFSPCAMGGTISLDMIQHCKAKIIAGAANNQLAHHSNAHIMRDRGILYLPDFLINAGGLIYAASTYAHQDIAKAHEKIQHIYEVTLNLLERAAKTHQTTVEVAEMIAFEKLGMV
ncbi:MAG: leucine dehydrogenase [Gammaproteobacteria bacterium RIFCSPLOWO2_02_FULL_42_14]|nr:MAG: leucine dehydrogenase [Gammaproteobacteria bacterium RIFCSPHIGHO2_02_FULL_42_43]OGT27418.1 MAG: leucine dehydrogenase [Gammaproteobacteria bacterium RIFCSPHIGHO2_01_FULL_42_8]OGT52373.1 MAG: leucine dehydrogenase [Gammaproteobacteria bacterium RIFCSPHIGHO2_12_FULL_41_25]OGT63336.1 MAG: leucine dehydrogenase [Gammaproteobacteria bacterium RIFCSPLOWO2_02_FULL_42_14]OGT86304.1 MAG: leucine dehydrogenase [Gammaproteobacteria bacterium RIFCSPLOWO2_12_FULL_42_18]